MEHLIELKDVYKIYQMGEETVHAPQMIGAAGGNIQTSDDVHGGGFAGPGLSHNSYKLTLVDGEAHAVQSVNVLVAHMVDLVDVF